MPHSSLVFLGACTPFQTSAGAEKQDTSRDASREVPERTHNDATKEARLHEGSVLPLRRCCRVGFSGLSRDASHVRVSQLAAVVS